VSQPLGQQAGTLKGPGYGGRWRHPMDQWQDRRDTIAGLACVTARHPELPQRRTQSDDRFGASVTAYKSPALDRPQIGALELQARQPGLGVRPVQLDLGLLGQLDEVRG